MKEVSPSYRVTTPRVLDFGRVVKDRHNLTHNLELVGPVVSLWTEMFFMFLRSQGGRHFIRVTVVDAVS